VTTCDRFRSGWLQTAQRLFELASVLRQRNVGWRVARGILESALSVAHHSVHLVPINVSWDNHDVMLGVLFGISSEIVVLAGSFQDEFGIMRTRHRWPSTVREVAAVAAGVPASPRNLGN